MIVATHTEPSPCSLATSRGPSPRTGPLTAARRLLSQCTHSTQGERIERAPYTPVGRGTAVPTFQAKRHVQIDTEPQVSSFPGAARRSLSRSAKQSFFLQRSLSSASSPADGVRRFPAGWLFQKKPLVYIRRNQRGAYR